MKTAREFWKDKWGEYPKNDAERLAIAMMAEYAAHVLEEKLKDNREMYLNMQYYYEYCKMKEYVTPQEWIAKHKHF